MTVTSMLKVFIIYIKVDVSETTSEIHKAKMDELKGKEQDHGVYFTGVVKVWKPGPAIAGLAN